MRSLFAFLAIVVLATAGWLVWGLWVPVSPGGQKFVMLRPGYGTRRIARELRTAGVIRSTQAFVLWHSLHRHPPLKAGEYLFEHDANAMAIHGRLARGDVYFHTVVVPEGYNMFDIAAAVEEAGLAKREDFLEVARKETSLIRDLDPQAPSLEGYLFPDTYRFTRTQSARDMAAAMVHRFRQAAHEAGLNQDVHKVVTMASIIEKETGAPEERPRVASVFYNRLDKDMALATDPSVIYAALLNNRYRGTIYQSDLHFDSPYNTYRYPGLPPGPISNPGKASLQAAIHPETTNYLYFVSDNQGHHRFSTTEAEHSRNVAAYRRATATNGQH